ncbi:hypothetical protein KKB43_03300 [Patescibacteria group bacterium]|nr:hypothetical protein [Patescibacteria group bacterium]MBU4141958.1 hypothetical protein [Patescibacteria group bacterium]MBU4339204.1 hypothetical protein [Patescibacteria group bacterium]MBU4580021.1 hypothetical protein [Patescibacteria group bacterium]
MSNNLSVCGAIGISIFKGLTRFFGMVLFIGLDGSWFDCLAAASCKNIDDMKRRTGVLNINPEAIEGLDKII